MVKKKEKVPHTKEEELLVCEECSRRFQHTDVTWLEYETRVVCKTGAKYLYPHHKSGGKYDTYDSALSVWSRWKLGICDFCASDTYDIDAVNPRDLGEALEDSGEPLTDGGVVNDYETLARSHEKEVERVYCNRCNSVCQEFFQLFANPECKIDNTARGMHGKCYVNENWSRGWSDSPSWQDVTEVTCDETIHLCSECFDDIKPSTLFRIKRKLKSTFK